MAADDTRLSRMTFLREWWSPSSTKLLLGCRPDFPETMKWPHTDHGEEGYYEWSKGGWYGYRAEAAHAMARLLGGAALAQVPATLATAAHRPD